MMQRRDLLKLGGMAVATTFADHIVWPLEIRGAGKVTPRRTARNCIVIQLPGAISPPDTWDFKETKDTPKDLDVQKVTSDLYLSKTLFPNHAVWAPRAGFVRSMRANELVHFTGQYHTQTGRSLNVAVAKEIPAFGSVVAYELDSERRDSDAFPTYMSFNLSRGRVGPIGAGFLPARFSGIDLDTTSVFDSFAAGDELEKANAMLAKRWEGLRRMAEVSPAERASLGDKAEEYKAYYDYAHRILDDPRWKKVFKVTDEEKKRWGNDFGISVMLARNVLAADAGTRFIYLADVGNGGNGPWDHHTGIFDRRSSGSSYVTCVSLDRVLTNLVGDLSSMPGKQPGKTLLDETLVVVTSEFGRVPYINAGGGRDHYAECYTTMFFGGGVKPGRVIGRTDETCAKCIDTGWKYKQQPWMDNTVATIYSALGIDWTKKIENTPSGRVYEYTQTAPIGGSEFLAHDEIGPLFE